MDASKENARKVLEEFKYWREDITGIELNEEQMQQFLEAAEKRLPSQAAIDKDKERKKQYSKNKKSKQTV